MLTAQEIFDKSVAGVLAQGRISYEGNSCRYAMSPTVHCAVGVLLPVDTAAEWDEMTEKSFCISPLSDDLSPAQYNKAVEDLAEAGIEYWKHEELLSALQGAHDSCFMFSGQQAMTIFRLKAQEVAEEYKLQFNF